MIFCRIFFSERQQFGNTQHGGDTECAVADKVGRNVDFHPPRLQSRNQRLNGMRLARNAVPQDKSDYDRHKAEDKSAQFLYGKTAS